jgi:hypothetical protein
MDLLYLRKTLCLYIDCTNYSRTIPLLCWRGFQNEVLVTTTLFISSAFLQALHLYSEHVLHFSLGGGAGAGAGAGTGARTGAGSCS